MKMNDVRSMGEYRRELSTPLSACRYAQDDKACGDVSRYALLVGLDFGRAKDDS